ncbi:TetR/AcrR family transcriptional regulator [Embleya hyalina]|uniref:TetR family transcriptional regulator n=1 Tax=Embleya hyalina TaxID=516124 RepID=A0A401YU06_9ACTN|nr:TetR/AcrR family transcriptional regulator [Embleya hyalina]GCD98077.1 TetR family transcriptional regulator [Embleya hyalina]
MGERRRRRPTKSGVVLSEDVIIECAVRLIGHHGAEALTVRRLGAALGCDPTAVYRYFRGTDDLLLAIADFLIGETLAGYRPGPDWVASLRELGLRVRDGHLRHPRVATVAAARVTRRHNEFRAVELGVSLLLSAGFSPADAARYYHVFIDTVLAHAALEASYAALAPEVREADDRAWEETYRRLPATDYPAIGAVRPHLGAGMSGSPFEDVLDLLLESLARRV